MISVHCVFILHLLQYSILMILMILSSLVFFVFTYFHLLNHKNLQTRKYCVVVWLFISIRKSLNFKNSSMQISIASVYSYISEVKIMKTNYRKPQLTKTYLLQSQKKKQKKSEDVGLVV